MLLPTAHAAELGDISVRSHIGQQLSADIELVMLTPEEQDKLQVRLAAPNVYQGANIAINPVLSSLRMSVVRRDQRHFLHLTTFKPVEGELLHLFLELGNGGQGYVRAATIWLTPDPAPLPPPRPMLPPPAPAPVAVAPPRAPSDAALIAATMRAAASRAAKARAASSVPDAIDEDAAPAAHPPAASASRAASAPPASASASASRRAAAPAHTPAASAASQAASQTAAPPPAAAEPAAAPRAPAAVGPGSAVAAACTPRQINEKLKQCIALDYKNAELTTKLVDLEGKIKVLQAALEPKPVPVAAAPAAPAALNPAGAHIAPSPAAAKAAKAASAKAKEKKSGLNMTTMVLLGIIALVAVVGPLVYWMRRKKINVLAGPKRLWQNWRRKKTGAPPEGTPAVEPILGNE